jgi:hypothetical protein
VEINSEELIHANVQIAKILQYQAKIEEDAKQSTAHKVHLLTDLVNAKYVQDIQEVFKLQVDNHAYLKIVDKTNTLINKVTADHAQLTNALTHKEMLATNQHAMIEHKSLAGLPANKLHAQHILDHKEVTAESALLNNVTVVNILQMMEDAINVDHIQFQMLETKTETDVFNHNAQQIQLSLLMEDVKPVEMVPIQIQVEDNVLDYNATTDKELLKQAQHQNVLIAQSEPELKIMELDAVLTNATQLTENILKKMEHATHVHLIKL